MKHNVPYTRDVHKMLSHVTSGNLSKSAFLEEGWVTERRFQMEGSVAHQPLLVLK